MSAAADRFTDAILVCWDSFSPWEDTARLGLAEVDSEAIASLCEETGDDPVAVEVECLVWIRDRAALLAAR